MKWLLLSIFWGLWFFNFSTRIIPSPVLPLIEDELILSHARAGGLFMFLYAGYAFSLLVVGSIAPKVGYKRCIICGFLCSSSGLFIVQYAYSYEQLVLLLLLIGLGSGVYLPSIMPMIVVSLPPPMLAELVNAPPTLPSSWPCLPTRSSISCFIGPAIWP